LRKGSAIAGALLVVVMFASCGGGAAAGDEEALEKMIDASLVETGPESCLKFSTLHFLEGTNDMEGEAAVKACEEAALDPLVEQPKKVDVSRIDVEGGSATALVAVKGSVLDGQKVRYAFVERDDRWKFDEWLGFVDLDPARLILEVGRDGLLRAESPWEAKNVACWIGRMERMSDQELEDLLFGDESSISPNCIAPSSAV
jgi:hypothetical protein